MAHVAKVNCNGISLIGLYVVALDNIVLVGHEVPEELDKIIEDVFKVPMLRISIAGTSLLGAFCATNGQKLLVPHIIFDSEEEALTKAGIDFLKVPSTNTCLGNNLSFTKDGLLLSSDFEPEVSSFLEDELKLSITTTNLSSITTVGSLISHNNNGKALVSNEITDEELNLIESVLNVKATPGSVNMGAIQVSSGTVANKNGFLIGEASGGPELINADQAFGFIE